MKRRVRVITLVAVSSMLMAQGETSTEAEHITQSSQEFEASRGSVLSDLARDGFTKGLLSSSLGAVSANQAKSDSARIKKGSVIATASPGKADTNYDIIIQPGHYGRTKGATGASGTLLAEKEIVAYLVGSVANRLEAMGYSVIVVPADNVVANKARIFLAVHAEGSTKPCSAGPSLAYKAGTTPYAMHSIGLGISRAMGYDYKNFRADGYTTNSANYYMYSRVSADKLTGLLEIGEITCPDSEQRMIVNADRIATNLTLSLEYIMKLE
jgi:hypothetical protein